MTDIKPDPAAKPLSSEELQHDADEAGVEADQSTHTQGDTHLPASEGELAGDAESSPATERDIAETPPD